jgi:hypothetical protein
MAVLICSNSSVIYPYNEVCNPGLTLLLRRVWPFP